MLKKTLSILSMGALYFAHAQSISTLSNTAEVYSNNAYFGTSKYNAMAGSTGALGGDANALLNNPAGLGVAIAGDLSGTLAIQNYKNKSSLSGNSVSYDNTLTDLGNVSGVATFQLLTEKPWKFINLGVSYSSNSLDKYVETPGNSNVVIQQTYFDGTNTVTNDYAYTGHAYNRTGNQSRMSIGVGANYDNRIYFGTGLNFQNVDLYQEDFATFNSMIDGSNDIYDKQYTPYSELANGFSMNFGVIGKLNNQFRVGASIETPTWWYMERSFNEYTIQNRDVYENNYIEDRKFNTPMTATLSAAMVPNKNFAVNVDYTLGITKPNYKEYGPAEVELNDFYKEHYKNQSEIKIGAEYRVKALRLRGGFAHATSPFDDISISAFDSNGNQNDANFSNLMIGSRNKIGLGIGYDLKSFFIDAAYQNISSDYKNPLLQGSEQYASGYYGIYDVVNSNSFVVSDVENVKNNFFLTLGWKF